MNRFGWLLVVVCQIALALGSFYGPPEDGFDWIDNTLPEEPVVGSAWRNTPSRKAAVYAGNRQAQVARRMSRASWRVGEDLRLPTNIIPDTYAVRLLPFIEPGNFTTHGSVEIFVTCVQATRNITMNSDNITIDASSITVQDLTSSLPVSLVPGLIDEQNTREMITIQTATNLVAGRRYKITIARFVSVLNLPSQAYGFYYSSYVEKNVTKYLATTQFEDVDARRAFPCFDEPNMKAVFSVTLGRKSTWSTAANMPRIGTNPIDNMPGWNWDFYQTTVKMPSYLVAFLVSEFVAVPASPGTGRVPFRLWVRPDYVSQADYSLKVAPPMQDFFEKLLRINYALPKQDLAAIPDFNAGAMENWGLITYRETALLVNPAVDARTRWQYVAAINAHELAHQWFGNYVTMDWWKYIWLNEGFASYMEWDCVAAVEPTWLMDQQIVIGDLHYAFGIDALETSRPLVKDVTTRKEISSMFDGISYQKGGCIIMMMSDFLGRQTFINGLTRYLDARAYGNAVQDDLWEALQQQANSEGIQLPATVKQIMDTWTLQMGYPVVTVSRNYISGATVSQERFLLRKTEGIVDTNVYRWWVPLTYTTASNPLQRNSANWLSSAEVAKPISIEGATHTDWVLFNVDQHNYYRVAYDAKNYDLLAEQLMADHRVISPRNRAQLLDDAFNLAVAHLLPYQYAMELSRYLMHEREYVPWRSVLTELDYIDLMLRFTPAFGDWKAYMTSLIQPYYAFVGFAETALDAHLTIYRRTDALQWACVKLGIDDCVRNAKSQYSDLMNQPNRVLSPNQRSLIMRTTIEYGTTAEWDFAFESYRNTFDTAYLTAMAYTQNSTTVSSLLEMMLDPNSIRRSDVITLFNNIAASPVGHSIAFEFLITRWDDIGSQLGNAVYESFFYALRSRMNTQEQLDKYIKLRDDHMDVLGSSDNVPLGITTVTENVKWMELHEAEVSMWLKAQTTTTTTQAPPTTASSNNIAANQYFAPGLAATLSILFYFM